MGGPIEAQHAALCENVHGNFFANDAHRQNLLMAKISAYTVCQGSKKPCTYIISSEFPSHE